MTGTAVYHPCTQQCACVQYTFNISTSSINRSRGECTEAIDVDIDLRDFLPTTYIDLSKLSSPLHAQGTRGKYTCKESSITYATLSMSRHQFIPIFQQIDLKGNIISWWTDHDTTACDHLLFCQDGLLPLFLHRQPQAFFALSWQKIE